MMSEHKRLRFVLIGGFLGAGKTTAMARLARHYAEQGKIVGLVTNDQAEDLVDTLSLRRQGLAVEEVAGACFCCRFNELVDKVRQLQVQRRPDVILAEPVGSCTDLVATVVQPLKSLYGSAFDVAPYAVLFKPSHGLRILQGESAGGFSPKAAYIFRKQLEEADAIALNRIDELSAEELDSLTRLIRREYPGTPLVSMSAKTGQGFEKLVEVIDQDGPFGAKILDIDYDVYAEGEAELGWLNVNFEVEASVPFSLDSFLLSATERLQHVLQGHRAEIAHLKIIGLGEQGFAVANLVSSRSKAELSMASQCDTRRAEIVVNARVAVDPQWLDEEVEIVVGAIAAERDAVARRNGGRSLRPGRPTPTHRYAAVP